MIYREYYVVYFVEIGDMVFHEDIKFWCNYNLLSNHDYIVDLRKYLQAKICREENLDEKKVTQISITNIIELKVPFFKRLYKTFQTKEKENG